MDRRQLIIEHIRERLSSLEELGKEYSEEKINSLADKLSSSDKTLTEVCTLIDNKFSNQVRKINHNKYLASLKEYYIANIDKLKKGNNCYLLSYEQGVKVLEQAYISEIKDINPFLKLVNINNDKKGYKKENSINNDYELIMSDLAYLLNIPYANTYRIFDEKMNPQGVVNISFTNKKERFLNLEETLRFIKEESPKFNLTQELLDYHDKNVKYGLKEIKSSKSYKDNIEYVIKLFKALPDISEENIEKLTSEYLNMKVFELLTNSLNNNLSNIGIIIDKSSLKYNYRLSPSYNKCTIELPTLKDNQTICNFFIVDKTELLNTLIKNYYSYIKDILSLITNNKDSLFPIINQVIKEHLEYTEYSKYYKIVSNNFKIITDLVIAKKAAHPDNAEDENRYMDNDISYNNRIAPFVDNYVADDEDKGSTLLLVVVTIVLFATIGIIALAIYALSKMNM